MLVAVTAMHEDVQQRTRQEKEERRRLEDMVRVIGEEVGSKRRSDQR